MKIKVYKKIEKSNTLYARISCENFKWVQSQAKKKDLSVAEFMDRLISALKKTNNVA